MGIFRFFGREGGRGPSPETGDTTGDRQPKDPTVQGLDRYQTQIEALQRESKAPEILPEDMFGFALRVFDAVQDSSGDSEEITPPGWTKKNVREAWARVRQTYSDDDLKKKGVTFNELEKALVKGNYL